MISRICNFYNISRMRQTPRYAPGAVPSNSTLRSVKRLTSLPKLTRNKNEIDPYKK